MKFPTPPDDTAAVDIPGTRYRVVRRADLNELCRYAVDSYPDDLPLCWPLPELPEHVLVLASEHENVKNYFPDDLELFRVNMPRKQVSAIARFSMDPIEPWCLVFAGSTVGKQVNSLNEPGRRKRNELEQQGVIADGQFTRSFSFQNYSLAACVITGDSVSGNVYWKDSAGRTLKDRGLHTPRSQ